LLLRRPPRLPDQVRHLGPPDGSAGHLASAFHARARTGTIRRQLINIPARIATGARRLTPHLPQLWCWADDFTDLWAATRQRMVT
ncbi:hypothetical protein ACFFTL_18900, partial [Streptomyces yanii]